MNRKMLRQAQKQSEKFQKDMAKMQQKLDSEKIETSVGGGVVKATVNGNMKLTSLSIDPEVVDPNDVEMLQDLIVSAINDGIEQIQEISNKKMSSITSGLNIPGLNIRYKLIWQIISPHQNQLQI